MDLDPALATAHNTPSHLHSRDEATHEDGFEKLASGQ